MTLQTSLYALAGRMLKRWVSVADHPGSAEASALAPPQNIPVIYVLESRSLSNLIVLQNECQRRGLLSPVARLPAPVARWRALYTVAPKEPFKAWLLEEPKHSKMLQSVVDAMQGEAFDDVLFIPVSLFWGRPVASQQQWFHILFAESWKLTGWLNKALKILVHGRDLGLHFGNPMSFKSLTAEATGRDDQVEALQRQLKQQLYQVRKATLGPDLSHRRSLVRSLLLKPDLKAAIARQSAESGRDTLKVTLEARRYCHEIMANCSGITIQVMLRALEGFWQRFYAGIDVSHQLPLHHLARSHELVYVPCHRSHIDYLLLSYVIYKQGLAIPYIAAGKNLNMPIVGTILRGGGAFFIRRTFKDNKLYSAVLFEYLAELLSKGVPIEYFIEGGRSRTGRLLKPKPGMLSMTVRGFLRDRQKPVAFIPVYLGYDKLMESKAYQAELMGEDKKAETFATTLKSIFSVRGRYGKVQVNFGEPLFLNQVLDQQKANWRSEAVGSGARPEWLSQTVQSSAVQIMQRINQASHINGVNLVACVLLASEKQRVPENQMGPLLELFRTLIHAQGYSKYLKMVEESSDAIIQNTQDIGLLQRKRHALGDVLYAENKVALSLTFYRNNILHVMALPSLLAASFTNRKTHSLESLHPLIAVAHPFLKSELFLPWTEEQLPEIMKQTLDTLVSCKLLTWDSEEACYKRPSQTTNEWQQLMVLAKVLQPIIEVYFLTLAVLSKNTDDGIERSALSERCQLLAERVSLTHHLDAPDYSDKHLINNFVGALMQQDYVSGEQNLEVNALFAETDRRIRLLLNSDMRKKILRIVRVY